MAFHWTGTHFPTLEHFVVHLRMHTPPPSWPRTPWHKGGPPVGVVIHHTAVPTVKQWDAVGGKRYMDSLKRYYRDTLGWPGGPHLFVGTDGIWEGTPLGHPGIHAYEPPNSAFVGVEVVGDYSRSFWAEPIKSLAFGVLTELARWLRLDTPLTPATMPGHREVLRPKPTCPGWAVDTDEVRAEVSRRLRGVDLTNRPKTGLYRAKWDNTWVREDATIRSARAKAPNGMPYVFPRGGTFPVDTVAESKDGDHQWWLGHAADIGWIRADQAERLEEE